VVIFHPPLRGKENCLFVKRVVGLPGEEVEVVDGRVFINGKPLKEDYAVFEGKTLTGRVKVRLGRNQYFLMGDNRNDSRDSRSFGPVERRMLLGRPLFRILPLSRAGFVNTEAHYDLQS
jgi:signal peptidase I